MENACQSYLKTQENGIFQGLKRKSVSGIPLARTSSFRRSHYQKTVTFFPGSAPAFLCEAPSVPHRRRFNFINCCIPDRLETKILESASFSSTLRLAFAGLYIIRKRFKMI